MVVVAGRDALIAKLAEIHREAMQSSLQNQVLVFAGSKLAIVGDPVRFVVFPDGTSLPINAAYVSESEDDGFILPPSLRPE